jgi:hypothetical protein
MKVKKTVVKGGRSGKPRPAIGSLGRVGLGRGCGSALEVVVVVRVPCLSVRYHIKMSGGRIKKEGDLFQLQVYNFPI